MKNPSIISSPAEFTEKRIQQQQLKLADELATPELRYQRFQEWSEKLAILTLNQKNTREYSKKVTLVKNFIIELRSKSHAAQNIYLQKLGEILKKGNYDKLNFTSDFLTRLSDNLDRSIADVLSLQGEIVSESEEDRFMCEEVVKAIDTIQVILSKTDSISPDGYRTVGENFVFESNPTN
jgi:hypothetical protein